MRRKIEYTSLWRNYKQRKALRKLPQIDKAIRQLQLQEALEVKGPVDFVQKILNTKPFPYQVALLEDPSKRIVACMGRQSGKTTTIALKAIYFAQANKGVTVLITSPSLRQSMIMFERITSLVYSSLYLRGKIIRATGTLIQFENRSKIIALPCSENLLTRIYCSHDYSR